MTLLPKSVRIGTRGSELARCQTDLIARRIEALGVAAKVIIVRTRGDIDQQTPVSRIGSKAIFIKELEDALLSGSIDIAVHSLKDLPVQLPDGLALAAVPERLLPNDAWICPSGKIFGDAPRGATIATGSLRRASQLLARRPDLNIVPTRGNVPTRLEKIKRGDAFATVLAAAGLRRLDLAEHITEILPAGIMTPAMGQGALAIEARDGEMPALFEKLEDPQSRQAADAERRFLEVLGGSCRTPVGILAQPNHDGWELTAMLACANGKHILRHRVEVAAGIDPSSQAESLARQMLAEAPPEILATLEETA